MLRKVRRSNLEKKSFNSCLSLGLEAKVSVFIDKQIQVLVKSGFETITCVWQKLLMKVTYEIVTDRWRAERCKVILCCWHSCSQLGSILRSMQTKALVYSYMTFHHLQEMCKMVHRCSIHLLIDQKHLYPEPTMCYHILWSQDLSLAQLLKPQDQSQKTRITFHYSLRTPAHKFIVLTSYPTKSYWRTEGQIPLTFSYYPRPM